MNIGDKVKFFFTHAKIETKNPRTAQVLKGKIIEHAKSGGFIIQVYGDDSLHSQNGTLCNRAESDIIAVI